MNLRHWSNWTRILGLIVFVFAISLGAEGQNKGKKDSDLGQEILKKLTIPEAPALSPEEEWKTFKIQKGFRVELVASEPLVSDPVAMTFDPQGRIWVCEMRGYMPDVNGTNEKKPVGTISILEDSDGDGVMDKSSVWLDGLVLPRALCWTTDGLLVCENAKIWHCRDLKGTGKCDDRQVICPYPEGNPEHSLNGLMPALDNRIYNAKEGLRLHRADGKWLREATVGRGQWGITQDDSGRLFYCPNTSLIRGDLLPCYFPNQNTTPSLANVPLYKEQQVFPIRVTPGVNRGYLPDILRPDGTLKNPTANCGPVIYRGDNLPKEIYGDVFICEPAGNLVRRNVWTDPEHRYSKNAYDKAEFLASTDERFRPINLYNSPDGTIYIVDMYRGVIQHRNFVTPFLKQQILDRRLEQPRGMGRIWRIAHESTQKKPAPDLGKRTARELVRYLASANGWHRDMAQQLLVQRRDLSVVGDLEKLVQESENPRARLHALWVLEGLGKVNPEILLESIGDKSDDVRSTAVSLLKSFVRNQADPSTIQELGALSKDKSDKVRMQLVFTLGLVNSPMADRAIEQTLKDAASNTSLLQSLLGGFTGNESEFLAARLSLPNWTKPEPWREKLIRSVASLLWKERNPLVVLRFQHLLAEKTAEQQWQQVALLEGLLSTPPNVGKAKGAPKAGRLLTLPAIPDELEKARKSPHARLATAAEEVAKQLNWAGKDGKPLPVLPPLPAKYQPLYEIGKKEFAGLCAACHHKAGYGEAGKGPPLLDSGWLDYSDERLTRLLLFGLRGPITVGGEVFNRDGTLEMPGMYQAFDDQKIAGILTYIRREWSDRGPSVDVETVTRVRASLAGKTSQWTEKELLEVK
jgi:mono/diheme cytochrome c family protein/glucose/arabinose dehydrogenase